MGRIKNNDVIEIDGITKLTSALIRTELVVPRIQQMDKAPSWDGELMLYRQSVVFRKADLIGRIPVQIKSTWVDTLSVDRATFQAETSDLRNYMNDRGVIYFLIQSEDFDNYRIFYASLLPFDLRKSLNEAGDQKTKQIEMAVFPHQDKDEIAGILSDFVAERARQGILWPDVYSMHDLVKMGADIKELEFLVPKGKTGSKEEWLKDLFSHSKYIYARPAGIDVPVVVDKIQIEKIVEKREIPVSVNGEVLYKQIQAVTSSEKDERYLLGSDITIIVNDREDGEGTVATYNFKFKGTLNEQIREMKFMVALMDGKQIKIGQKEFHTEGIDNIQGHTPEEVKERLSSLLLVKKTMGQLHVKKDLNLGELTDKELRWLNYLVAGILYGKAVPLSLNGKPGIGKLAIGNTTLLIDSGKDPNGGKYFIRDFFANEKLSLVPDGTEVSNGLPVSPYVMLTADLYQMIDNIELSEIMPSVKRQPYSEVYRDRLILLALELLKIYDHEHDERTLDIVLQLFDYLQEHDSSDEEMYKINRLQTEKRRRELTRGEKQYLMKLKASDSLLTYKLAACILLESYQEAQVIYDEIDKDEREEFDTYPIMCLWPRN